MPSFEQQKGQGLVHDIDFIFYLSGAHLQRKS